MDGALNRLAEVDERKAQVIELRYFAGMTHEEILSDFPYLTEEDIRACLAFAADRERKTAFVAGEATL